MNASVGSLQPKLALQAATVAPFCPEKLNARLALTSAVLHDAWRVRHDSYVSQGYLDPRPDGLFQDEYDHDDTSITTVLYHEDVPVASVRVSRHDTDQLARGRITMPTFEVFSDVIPDFLVKIGQPGQPATAAEANRLVCLPEYRKDLRIISGLFRIAKYLTKYLETDVTFVSARRNHIPIYRRIGFHVAAEPRPYSKLRFDTALLAAIYPEYETIQRPYPALSTVRKGDQWYNALLTGEPVPVFPNGMNPWRETTPTHELETA